MTDLLVASRNRKKLAELRRVLDAAGISGLTLLSLDDVAPFDEAPETGATFEENAVAKARDAFRATGLASVADDSGLEVDALNGMPGVLSARWAGVHGEDAANTALLLAQLRDVPDERRGGAFVSACALVSASGRDGGARYVAGQHRARTAGRRRFWLRSGVHPRRLVADGGRADAGGEGRGIAPGPGVGLAGARAQEAGLSLRPVDHGEPAKRPCQRDRHGEGHRIKTRQASR